LPNSQDSQPKVRIENSLGIHTAAFVQKDILNANVRVERYHVDPQLN